MTSLEIAELTGKQHKNVMQAIRNMEPAWEKTCGLKFQLTSRIIDQPNGGTREVPCYQLTKTECLYIATKFNDEARARLVLRWQELELQEQERRQQLCLPSPKKILALADEKFMALSYARYVEHLAKAAREIHDMPLYVNAAMNSRGRRPGEYPSAGPLAHLIDFWHEGAPSIDLLAPDIYDTGFKSWCAQYAMPLRPQDGGRIKNRLFIPESRCCENSGVRALYAFGEHQAIGFSPFAIDQASEKETESVTQAYGLIKQLAVANSCVPSVASGKAESSLFTIHSSLKTWGLLFDQEDRERIIDDDGVVMTCRHYFTLPWDPRATDGTAWPEGGAMLIRLSKYEYLLAGSGVVIDFKTPTEKQQTEQKQLGEDGFAEAGGNIGQKVNKRFSGKRLGLLSVDEVAIADDGTMQYLRRHNGDQTHQGRHARIGVGEWKILHIKLYEY